MSDEVPKVILHKLERLNESCRWILRGQIDDDLFDAIASLLEELPQ